MKKEYKNYVISKNATVLDAIKQMDNFKNGQILILFVEDDDSKILGSVTSGDIRRCFLKGITVNSPITDAMQKDFHYYATYCAALLAGYTHREALAEETGARSLSPGETEIRPLSPGETEIWPLSPGETEIWPLSPEGGGYRCKVL